MNNLHAEIFLVGGASRDLLLGKKNKDIDLVVRKINIEKLLQHLHQFGIAQVVGKSFGVITFKDNTDGEVYDIALPRTEFATGEGGHKGFDITYDENLPIEKDLIRRDAKFNAIAINLNTNQVIDPHGGLDDIKNKQVSLVNPDAFTDDPLRLLRFIGFASRNEGFIIEPESMKKIQQTAHRIKEISAERIIIEFNKIIQKGQPEVAARLLVESKLYENIFGVQFNDSYDDFPKVKNLSEFIYLLTRNSLPSPSKFYAKRFKNWDDLSKIISAFELTRNEVKTPAEERWLLNKVYSVAPDAIGSFIVQDKLKDISKHPEEKYPRVASKIAVTGDEIKALGIKDQFHGMLNRDLLNLIYNDQLENTHDAIMSYIQQNINKYKPNTPQKIQEITQKILTESVNPNLIEYTTRELFKQVGKKNADWVFAHVAKKFNGAENFLLGGKVNITKEELKDAVYKDKAETFIQQYQNKPEKKDAGLPAFAAYFNLDAIILKQYIDAQTKQKIQELTNQVVDELHMYRVGDLKPSPFYVTPSKEYANKFYKLRKKQYADVDKPHQLEIDPGKVLDLTDKFSYNLLIPQVIKIFQEKGVTFTPEELKELEKKYEETSPMNWAPLYTLINWYPQFANATKRSGFDSIKQLEVVNDRHIPDESYFILHYDKVPEKINEIVMHGERKWFHNTAVKNLAGIKAKGLLPNSGVKGKTNDTHIESSKDYYHGIMPVFLTTDPKYFHSFGDVSLEVDINGLNYAPDFATFDDWLHKHDVIYQKTGKGYQFDEELVPEELWNLNSFVTYEEMRDNPKIANTIIDIVKSIAVLDPIPPDRIRVMGGMKSNSEEIIKEITNKLLAEEIEKITFTNEVVDSYSGQLNCEAGICINNQIVGYIQYVLFEKELTISYIFIHPNLRRKGYASKLMNYVIKQNPGYTYKPSLKTDLGAMFKQKQEINEAPYQYFNQSDVLKVEKALLDNYEESYDVRNAAYITPNGYLISLMQRDDNSRADHRNIGGFIEDLGIDFGKYNEKDWETSFSKWMYAALDMGFIRVIPEAGAYVEMRVAPTGEQLERLRELCDAYNGKVTLDLYDTQQHSIEFEYETPTEWIIEEIRRFFYYGEMPRQYGYEDEDLMEGKEPSYKASDVLDVPEKNKKKTNRYEYWCNDDKLPANLKDRLSVGRTPSPKEEAILNSKKKLLGYDPYGTPVYLIDGEFVRQFVYPDFSLGGNDQAYPNFVPKNQIWIEEDIVGGNRETTIAHESKERHEMFTMHKFYDVGSENSEHGAHVDALKQEHDIRDGEAKPTPLTKTPPLQESAVKNLIFETVKSHAMNNTLHFLSVQSNIVHGYQAHLD
jgi:tRNA nucleotidyltransferase/poly(A) polymerase/ribosomal protein S18 acetylase RimI-like enzyme